MKILLMCAAGMSTSLLVTKMQKYAGEIGRKDLVINAEPVEDLDENVDDYDVFLLGPQVKYKEKWVKEIVDEKGKPYACIPVQLYGRIDGKSVLELALNLMDK
ncbi:PTS sugar transporter subunit IIB [Clostridium beijerinckii]|uniref:PTS system cellobiose-specific IIB component n=1 Tax=Clostridium beijerinckii TaxID=1520 RepID=A0A9Q5CLZ6_CLOBE|nr:PTS sugar transporter subunit IIB [Clostridium beijerinckii]AQS03557.1 lichenan-specific phosphotransferase enzyme IIB component [Clostridium beijerinckii]MBA2884814.1 PTS system cellobiose-specific IIB component [Clostridium beijerinckii]MBA2899536.1 PTS system cellobiose-specific IIB component [Clostridium beijerinckii]MBA2909165.1 PTS system cellobiose-specific IIB component [Clostridium beijerinckii]MBA9016900.1 PTS system cellobiose-specific IIB component [Clostridium beijerinckii]